MPETHEPSDHLTPPASTPPAPAYAPPHPYRAPEAPAGNGLSITAMALGLVSILTAGVGFFVVSPLGLFAALFAIAAIVLGIIALVRRQRGKAPAIAGIATGAVGGLASVALAAYVVLVALSPGWTGGFDSAPTETQSQEPDSSDAAPQEFTSLDFEGKWPANYADGGITFDDDLLPVPSAALTPGDIPQSPAAERGDGPADILLFVDYRCPICMNFEQANSATLEDAVASGNATLQVRTLTFLDRASSGSEYSSRAAGAMACIAEEQPDSAWLAHTTLLSSSVQPPENTPGLNDTELIAAIEGGTGALSPAARSCITERTFVPFAQAFTNWSFENAVPGAVDPALMVEGTPLAVVNGVPYQGAVNDPAAFRDFLEAQGVETK